MFALVMPREESSELFPEPANNCHDFVINKCESFGYQDGISNPIIKGVDDGTETGRAPQGKEPKAVKPG
jgi:hypothetical protein